MPNWMPKKKLSQKRKTPKKNLNQGSITGPAGDHIYMLSAQRVFYFTFRRRRASEMSDTHLVTTTPLDAQYLLMLTVDFKDEKSVAKLQIEFKGPLGYLSAMEYPLLTFFMVRKSCIL